MEVPGGNYGRETVKKCKKNEIVLAMCQKRCRMKSVKRGYSLMAKLQPSKLAMRVRFPLPACL